MPETLESSPLKLSGERVVLVGRFGGYGRREVTELVAERGGVVSDESPSLWVVGDETPPDQAENACQAARDAGGDAVGESEFLVRLGLVQAGEQVRRLYTPAMLAELVAEPVSVIRRWTRRGHLQPTLRVNRLAYYGFAEAGLAKRLAELHRDASSLAAVDRLVDELAAAFPRVERPLLELPLVFDRGAVYVREGESLTEPGGQRRFDFESDGASDGGNTPSVAGEPDVLSIETGLDPPSADDLYGRALDLRDEGELPSAIETLRLAMLQAPPSAEDHFTLGEWLYETGQPLAARERYYAALELDDDYVEARVNLGCVLEESGQTDLAVAAFEGAIACCPDYADAHFHLALTLERKGDPERSAASLRRFLEIAPGSPWADEASRRLAEATDG